MQLVIKPGGDVACLYDEALDLPALGVLQIRRGSLVEPDESGQWWADLSPVQGPKLGPFRCRSQALDAEVTWLEANWLLAKATAAPSSTPQLDDQVNQDLATNHAQQTM